MSFAHRLAAVTAGAIALTSTPFAIAREPVDVVREFFERYDEQDVSAMLELFTPNATLHYVPFGDSAPAAELGPQSWGGLIDAFPDLANEVHSIRATADDTFVYADVNISGTQTKDVFGIENEGKTYDLRHLFMVELTDDGKIAAMTAFWDSVSWYRQLGKTEIE